MVMPIRYNDTDKPQPASTLVDNKDVDLVSKVKMWKSDVEQWVGTWETNQNKWHKLRMRIKKEKNFPFPGCSNIRMPTIETKLRKVKAALCQVVFGIRPVVSVIPSPSGNWDTAKKIEKFLDWLIMDIMGLKTKSIIAIDQALEKGFYLLKPHWRVETTTRVEKLTLDDISMDEAMFLFNPQVPDEQIYQSIAQRLNVDMNPMVALENIEEVKRVAAEIMSGADEVNFTLQDVLYNYPDVALCPPERVYVPTTTGYDPQSAEYIIHEFLMPLTKVKQCAESKGWSLKSVEDIELKKKVDLNDKTIDVTKDEREGIERLQSDNELVRVWECYCWYDINGDGVREKCVVTVAPDFGRVLRKISLPFYSGEFPFIKLYYELTDDRWFSHRGIPELIEDIVKEIDIQHMQKIDYGTLANTPTFAFKAGQIGESTTQFLFGQGIPVRGLGDIGETIQPLNIHNPNIDFSYQNEQMLLETKIEEIIGQVDYSLQSMINKRQPRTASEVGLQQQNMQQVFSLDADMFTEQFTKVFKWVYDLWCQYGDDSVEFTYFGENGYEPIKLTREEVQGKYKITVRGNDQNTNPAVKQQKAMFLANDAMANLQLGLVSPQAVLAAKKRVYQEMGIEGWQEFLQPPPPPPQPDDIKLKGDDLTDGEKAQVLQKRGIKPDVVGRKMNEDNRRDELEFDQLAEVAKALKQTGGDNGRARK